jgi:hypothetical protein
MDNTTLRELVDIVIEANSGATSAQCFYSGRTLGGVPGYMYLGYFTNASADDITLTTLSGGGNEVMPGAPQSFVKAAGGPFEFVGYRIRLF